MKNTQFILDADGNPAFAVLPIDAYEALTKNSSDFEQPSRSSLLSADGRYVRLPNAGPDFHLDVLQLADLLQRRGTVSLAIAQRAQSLEKFNDEQFRNGLDPLIRRCFLPEDSPYKNTMQASNEVVDALVQTGIFEPAMIKFPAWYRPVKSIKVKKDELLAFIDKHGPLPKSKEIDIINFI